MEQGQLIPHLFRTEYSRIVSVICKQFGLLHISTAEDLASETFVAALESWPYKGVPENPVAWLYSVAKNKTKNRIGRDILFAKTIARDLGGTESGKETREIELDLSDTNISDSQLQMLFAVCHPVIPVEAQVGLALRILCGFGPAEIANAFLSNTETVSKRIQRAKDKLRTENIRLEFPAAAELGKRLEAVMLTIYLLFTEGYYSETNNLVIRRELCFEAMKLNKMLLDSPVTNTPAGNALMALMCFQASRIDARVTESGELILYDEQDEENWDQELISRGHLYFHLSATGDTISTYHLEAGIAYWNTVKEESSGKWERILDLYNKLLSLRYSPVAALNRTFALSRARGKKLALEEALKLKLSHLRPYHLLLAELYAESSPGKSAECLNRALDMTVSEGGREVIRRKLNSLLK